MSRIRFFARLVILGGLLAGFSAPAQAATPTTLQYRCKYPLIGVETIDVSVRVGSNIVRTPDAAPLSIEIAGVGTPDGADGLRSIPGVASFSGQVLPTLRFTDADGAITDAPEAFPISQFSFNNAEPASYQWVTSGRVPVPQSLPAGSLTLGLEKLQLNLSARDAAGAPIPLVELTRGVNNEPVTPSDADPNTFDVYCSLATGASTKVAELQVIGPVCTATPPALAGPGSVPVSPSDVTSSSVLLRWTPAPVSPAPCNPLYGLTGYEISNGSQVIGTVGADATSFNATGLSAGTTYTFSVRTVDTTGSKSEPLLIRATTNGGGDALASYSYSLTGSATLNTLTTGTVPLKGAIAAKLAVATGDLTADLTLGDTFGRLIALGFLPVTAKIGFGPAGKTTGKLLEGVLTTNTKVRIKVKDVRLMSFIPLVAGNTCQTKQLSDITLRSTQPEFRPTEGGPIAGTFKISDLNGCGGLNGLVSPLTAGGGNTISLTLAPKVAIQ